MTDMSVKRTPDEEDARRAVKHPLFRASNQQIENYVENNVTDLESAKELFTDMLKLMRGMAKHIKNAQENK